VVGRVKYDIDLWGKAAFWGTPRPLSLRVGAAWWRERFRTFTGTGRAFGENDYATSKTKTKTVGQRDQQNLDHWMVEGSVFIPLIPTHTQNLAGTASLLTQWFVGAGLDGYFEDFPASSSYLEYKYSERNYLWGDRMLMKRWGGFVQLQYYFTNQWYAQAVWGINRAFGVDRDLWLGDSSSNDPFKSNQHILCHPVVPAHQGPEVRAGVHLRAHRLLPEEGRRPAALPAVQRLRGEPSHDVLRVLLLLSGPAEKGKKGTEARKPPCPV
jgi:hypothetical protein